MFYLLLNAYSLSDSQLALDAGPCTFLITDGLDMEPVLPHGGASCRINQTLLEHLAHCLLYKYGTYNMSFV